MRTSETRRQARTSDVPATEQLDEHTKGVSRRSFVTGGIAAGIGAGLVPFAGTATALARNASPSALPAGDAAILRFLAVLETIEADLWEQYNELGGIQDSEEPSGSGNPTYTKALQKLDEDMPQYIHDNTDDEFTHWFFLEAYLRSRGGEPVNLEKFRVLPSSEAPGAAQKGRLTNLMELTVDTTWWTRYRSATMNPDLGGKFQPAVAGLMEGAFPAIPRNKKDLAPHNHIQAIANTAGFHFATIEQGGTSLYPSLAQRVTDPEVLRVLLSIGPTEAMHFQTWHDKAGNAPALEDPTNGLVFPNLNEPPFGGEEFKTNLIMPEPTVFLRKALGPCSIVRPTKTQGAAMGAVKFLIADGLFRGQSDTFVELLTQLAKEADAATRE
jgi:rubrerythrin